MALSNKHAGQPQSTPSSVNHNYSSHHEGWPHTPAVYPPSPCHYQVQALPLSCVGCHQDLKCKSIIDHIQLSADHQEYHYGKLSCRECGKTLLSDQFLITHYHVWHSMSVLPKTIRCWNCACAYECWKLTELHFHHSQHHKGDRFILPTTFITPTDTTPQSQGSPSSPHPLDTSQGHPLKSSQSAPDSSHSTSSVPTGIQFFDFYEKSHIFGCPFPGCSNIACSLRTLLAHHSLFHADQPFAISLKLPCNTPAPCSQLFSTFAEVRQHMKTEHKIASPQDPTRVVAPLADSSKTVQGLSMPTGAQHTKLPHLPPDATNPSASKPHPRLQQSGLRIDTDTPSRPSHPSAGAGSPSPRSFHASRTHQDSPQGHPPTPQSATSGISPKDQFFPPPGKSQRQDSVSKFSYNNPKWAGPRE
jgi:hypothetical protein